MEKLCRNWKKIMEQIVCYFCVILEITGLESLPAHKRRLADFRWPLPVSILQTRGVTGPPWSLWVAEEPAGGKYHWHVQTRVQQVKWIKMQRCALCLVYWSFPVSDPEGSGQRASSLWVRMLQWMTEHFTFCMSFFPPLMICLIRVQSTNSPRAFVIHPSSLNHHDFRHVIPLDFERETVNVAMSWYE